MLSVSFTVVWLHCIAGWLINSSECSVPSGTCACSNKRTGVSDTWWSTKGCIFNFTVGLHDSDLQSSPQSENTFFLALTLSNPNRFSSFFHCLKESGISTHHHKVRAKNILCFYFLDHFVGYVSKNSSTVREQSNVAVDSVSCVFWE